MQYTFTQLQALVAKEVQANLNIADNATHIKDSINLALFDITRERGWPELKKKFRIKPFATASAGTAQALPVDFVMEDRIRFTSNSKQWRLLTREGLVPPAPIFGKPRAYVLVAYSQIDATRPLGIVLDPYTAIDDTNDELNICYYAYHPLLVAADDTPKSNMWDAELVRRATARYFARDNKLPQAQFILNKMAAAAAAQVTSQAT